MELTLDQALQKGIEAHKAGKVQEADRYYTAILKANPKHPDANHNMGVLAVGVGKVEVALPFFKTAIGANPSIAQYWLSYINALIKLNRMADAKAVFDQAKSKGAKGDGFDQIENQLGGIEKEREVNPTSNIQEPPGEQLQGLINLYTQGQYHEALTQASQVLSQFPNSINLYNIIGASNQRLGKLDKSIEAYNKALSINPDYADAYYNMGVTLKKQGKLDEAIEAFNKAFSIKPDYADAYYNMGVTLKEQGKLDEAMEAYNKALDIKPNNAEAYNNLGNALKEQGKLDEAIEAFNKALAIKPVHADACNNLGNALKEQGKLDEAIEAYNKALDIKPNNADAYYNIGIALKEQGKLDEAIEAFNKALDIKPNNAEAYNNLGNALKEQGKVDEAIEAYNNALAIKPDHGSAKHMLSALTGNKNETAPREYVENLFDAYSKKFEASLVDNLAYKIPKLTRDILVKPNSNESLGSVLDLGCGTGLLGPEIRDYCSNLEGIDLSIKMLGLAKRKNVYDKLSQADIIQYLSSKPLDFDYFMALDVFVYIGNISEIFCLIKSQNKKPGKLVFSTEHTELDGYHILKTGRYSHSKTYIESLCREFDYSISHFSTNDLRKEKERFLKGAIYVLNF